MNLNIHPTPSSEVGRLTPTISNNVLIDTLDNHVEEDSSIYEDFVDETNFTVPQLNLDLELDSPNNFL
jgi:hypothetical protein